jgi:8-oxo-dGTP pyrophosphatase MutT (NUDIX family)
MIAFAPLAPATVAEATCGTQLVEATMPSDLAAFLGRHSWGVSEEAVWLDGAIRLRIDCYLTREQPPSQYVVSARCLVLKGSEVLALRNAGGWHVLPGGRRERGEEPEDTVRREVVEESGWHVDDLAPLGFMHLHHLTPKPPDYEFLYPDFLWSVHVAQAGEHDPHATASGDYEEEALFMPIDSARSLPLSKDTLYFLDGAIDRGLAK